EARREMAADACGVVGPVVALDRLGTDALLRSRITGTADDSRYPDGVFDDALARRVPGFLQDGQQLSGARRRQQRLIVAGEDDREGLGASLVPGRKYLRNHAAHRRADDVRRVAL